ncbi:MAG: CPBP family intramembrane metalloprotease [Gallionella sp.]|nr:CPBP family intramembrane metalloprotease [Gallionella sp.]
MSFEFTARQNKFGALLAFGFFLVYIASMYAGGSIGVLSFQVVFIAENAMHLPISSADENVVYEVIHRISGMAFGGMVLLLLITLSVRKIPQKVSFPELGFVRSSWTSCVAAFLIGLSLSLFFMLVLRRLFPFDGERLTEDLSGINEAAEVFRYMAAFCFVVLAPLNEEMLFRGVLSTGFTNSFGKFASGIVVTLLFASVHPSAFADGYWVHIAALLSYSIILYVLRIWSGSLYPCIAMHAGINSALIFPVQIFTG